MLERQGSMLWGPDMGLVTMRGLQVHEQDIVPTAAVTHLVVVAMAES